MNTETIDNKTKKALYRLISEEWIAATMYEQMVLACIPEERSVIHDLFLQTASDEKNDHYTKLVNFALEQGVEIPCKMSEYSKYALKEVVKQFETWKKNKDAGYYIDEGIRSEQLAVSSYIEILNDEDVCDCLKSFLLEIYYDEIEHLSNLNTLKLAYTVGAQLKL